MQNKTNFKKHVYTCNQLNVTPKFFTKYYTNIDSLFINIGACRSLWNEGSWEVFKANGASAMLGYTDYVNTRFAADMSRIIYRNLVKGKTLKYAMDRARDTATTQYWVFGGWPADGSNPAFAARLQYRGDSNFVLVPSVSYLLVNLQTDLIRKTGLNTNYTNVSSRYDPLIQGDSVLIKHRHGDTIPLRQKLDNALNVSGLVQINRQSS